MRAKPRLSDIVAQGDSRALDGKTLTITATGTATWLPKSGFYSIFVLSNNAVLANAGTFEIQTNSTVDLKYADSTNPQFTNSGTIRKTLNTGTATVDVNFVNTGTLEAASRYTPEGPWLALCWRPGQEEPSTATAPSATHGPAQFRNGRAEGVDGDVDVIVGVGDRL